MENIRELPPMERPREKLRYQGPASLSDAELLAVILGSGTKGLPVSVICNNLLKETGIRELGDVTLDRLCAIRGVGEVKALMLLAVAEVSRRLSKPSGATLKNDQAVYEILRPAFEKMDELQYVLVLMTGERELLATAEAGCMLPAVTWITGLAMEAGARRIVLARNGWLTFSGVENQFLKELGAAAGVLGICLAGLMAAGPERYKMIGYEYSSDHRGIYLPEAPGR